ncbi:DMT family transporter [Curvibacter sp. CHRR-16]|uniref:DMT family transporter n=1 Tax=Curvibacter sp. CHRR-16 TaxID=2835872 RepID=UPI001BDB027D|nr:DMT family transporter [Curvibacter sp. CHRR-16]MBT0570993.1 DMT family transporter [Curvibacter sp. CHRR-16]
MPASASHGQHPLRGIALAVAAMACFATLDTTTKWVAAGMHVMMALALRYAVQALITTAVVLPGRGWQVWRTQHLGLHVLRGLLLLSVSVLAFISLRHLPMGDFTAIVLLTPVVVTLVAARMLGDSVSWQRKLLVVVGFGGTLLILRPGADDFQWLMLLPFLLVLINAAFQLLTSRMTRTESPMTMQLYTAWSGAIIPALMLPWIWEPVANPALWGGIVATALLASVGHYLFTLAFKHAPVATVMPFNYTQIGFAVLGGWLAFDQMPDTLSWLGMALIAACGATSAWLTQREQQAKRYHSVLDEQSSVLPS